MALKAGTASYNLAQKSLAADQRKYELGAETNFFVLDSQSRLAQAEPTLLQTQIQYQVAVASVHHAIGFLSRANCRTLKMMHDARQSLRSQCFYCRQTGSNPENGVMLESATTHSEPASTSVISP
ncbi:MAG: TolC family protein [Terracidiphilus sp.]